MSVMFAAPSGGSRPTNGNLFEVKAGRARLETGSAPDKRKVVADKAKGTVFIKQTPDQLMHFCWKNRETSGSDDIDLIVFPGDTEFIKIKECADARMFMLKFKNTSDDRRLFWLQENVKDKDEEIVKKVNDFLNNPPPQRQRTGAGSDRGNALLQSLNGGDDIGALGNMDQNQLMQLFSLMQGGNGADMLPLSIGNRGSEKDGGSVDEASGSSDPLPGQVPVAPQSIGNPDLTTPNMPGGKKQPRIKADQLRSIISSIATQPSDSIKGNTPSSSSTARGLRAPVELTDVINRANVADAVASNAERLIPHLPDQEPIKKDETELKETLNTPQFRKATSEFGHGLQTGQMGPVLEAFNIPKEAVNAAQSGNVLEFAKKLTASETGTKEVGGKKRRPDDSIPEIDAQINADAEAQETTESSIKEPSAKKGKTDDDKMDLD